MSCVGVSRRERFNEKILLRKQHRQGVDVEAAFAKNLAQKVSDLQQKTQKVVEELVPRLQLSTREIESLTEKVVQTQVELTGTEQIGILQTAQKTLRETLLQALADLETEKRGKMELLHMLSTLRKKVEDAPAFAFSNSLHEAGNRISHRVATGKQMSGPEDHMGRQRARMEQVLKLLNK